MSAKAGQDIPNGPRAPDAQGPIADYRFTNISTP
jgi:hypothetical protein